MCGINGFSFPNETLVENMNKAISHRGPDGGATHCEENISLGHLRLAIIDLSEAAYQPMFYSKEEGASNSKIQKENNEKAKYCIVFNGEIYNYQELRKELGEEGYHFTTQGDTEVIMAAYDNGEKTVVNTLMECGPLSSTTEKNNSYSAQETA